MCFLKKDTLYCMVLNTVICSEVEWDMEREDLDSNLGQVPVTWALVPRGSGSYTHLTGNCEMSQKIMKVEIFGNLWSVKERVVVNYLMTQPQL